MSLLSAGAFVQFVLLRHCRYPVIRHHLFVFNMIRRAAGKINVGFLTTILILMGWGDWKLPVRFIIGFQAVGLLEDTHIWSATEIARPESEADLLAERPGLMEEISRRRADEDTAFLWQSLLYR